MPDDDRTRRRLGDETKSRIADLASGWTVEPEKGAAPGPSPAEPGPAPRKKPRTVPPPPPGSAERKALENAIVETKAGEPAKAEAVAEQRSKPVTAPPAIPNEDRRRREGPRAKPTAPPPIPQARPAGTPQPTAAVKPSATGTPQPVAEKPSGAAKSPAKPASSQRTPPVIVDESLTIPEVVPPVLPPTARAAPPPTPPSPPKLAVPVGEFDSGIQTVEEDKLRVAYHHATIKRDAADALLGVPDKPIAVQLHEVATELRGDPTVSEPKTAKFDRSDPTDGERGDATMIEGPSHRIAAAPSGRLRATAALRRKRGVIGDVFYVSTVLFGVRQSRRELAELEQRQQIRQTSRRHHLVTLGRTAVMAETFDHPALSRSREQLAAIEEDRSKHNGAVAASDAELDRVRRDRDAAAKQYAQNMAALDAELADLARKHDPLEKEIAAVKKRASEVQESLQRIERQLADTEASLHSVKAEKMDRAAIMADIATLKADRKAVKRDEPLIAAELDALNPRLAALDAARSEAQRKKRDLEQAETADHKRTAELLEAIGAKRKVVERAAGEAETARDKILFELGERLYVDRHANLAAQLSPIDQIDLELGESDRRIMELREILSNVDKAKLARGAAVIVSVSLAVGAFIGWLIYMLV